MKTVLNKTNIDATKNPLFLGEDLSLQRYDKQKYPKFYDLYDQQLNFFWRPQEVSLVKDISDYKNEACHKSRVGDLYEHLEFL
jgi:ribonucleotide reductase beta subunit family protein with ferritin-like domain